MIGMGGTDGKRTAYFQETCLRSRFSVSWSKSSLCKVQTVRRQHHAGKPGHLLKLKSICTEDCCVCKWLGSYHTDAAASFWASVLRYQLVACS